MKQYHKTQHNPKLRVVIRISNLWTIIVDTVSFYLHIRIAYNVLLKALMFEPGKPKYNICLIDRKYYIPFKP